MKTIASNRSSRRVRALVLICAAALVSEAGAQAPASKPIQPPGGPTGIFTIQEGPGLRRGRDIRTESLASRLMARDMPYRIILPPGYHQETWVRYPVVYLLHGLMGHHTNWTDKTSIGLGNNPPQVIIVTPEGDDGWYTDSVTKPNDKYETYIIKELIPEIDKQFRTLAGRQHRAIAGLSMGGYGAVKFGLKYPETFALAGSFSGALGIADITEKRFPGAVGKSIDAVFGAEDSGIRKANDPFEIIRRATPEKIGGLPFLYIDCGTEDFLFQSNRAFVTLLLEKDVPHEYRQLPGAHNWSYWAVQVEEFLELSEKRFTKSQNRER